MILVVGGKGSGKREFVLKRLGCREEQIADAVLDDRPVVDHLETMVRGCLSKAEELLEPLSHKQVVICDEVGCGVVPLDREENQWREQVGRLCVELAKRACCVVRIQCGIPVVLKGELP